MGDDEDDEPSSSVTAPLCALTSCERLVMFNLLWEVPAGATPTLPPSLTSLELQQMANFLPSQVGC